MRRFEYYVLSFIYWQIYLYTKMWVARFTGATAGLNRRTVAMRARRDRRKPGPIYRDGRCLEYRCVTITVRTGSIYRCAWLAGSGYSDISYPGFDTTQSSGQGGTEEVSWLLIGGSVLAAGLLVLQACWRVVVHVASLSSGSTCDWWRRTLGCRRRVAVDHGSLGHVCWRSTAGGNVVWRRA